MTELLDKKHHREDIDCGKDIKRKLSACFVLSENETSISMLLHTNHQVYLDFLLFGWVKIQCST